VSAGFDAVVIGAGPAGEVCAGKLADEGMRVAVAERELVKRWLRPATRRAPARP
jgi:flavin-dependent dehydrogenase